MFNLSIAGRYAVVVAGLLVVAGMVGFFGPFQASKADKQSAWVDSQVNAVDVGFLQSMLLHHAQAVQMSQLVQGKLTDEVGDLARAIHDKQNFEQGLMTGWLSAWGKPPTLIGAPMKWVEEVENYKTTEDALYAAQCRAANGAMPGLATPEQIKSLGRAKGIEKTQQFLTLMTAHHEGAIPMARFAYNHGQSMMIKNFALNIMKEQQVEIDWMKRKLEQLAKVSEGE